MQKPYNQKKQRREGVTKSALDVSKYFMADVQVHSDALGSDSFKSEFVLESSVYG